MKRFVCQSLVNLNFPLKKILRYKGNLNDLNDLKMFNKCNRTLRLHLQCRQLNPWNDPDEMTSEQKVSIKIVAPPSLTTQMYVKIYSN